MLSFVISIISSIRAWTMIIRSKGSLWIRGSSLILSICLGIMGKNLISSLTLASSISTAEASMSIFPIDCFIPSSQREAILIYYSSLSCMILFASFDNISGLNSTPISAFVSNKYFIHNPQNNPVSHQNHQL